MKLAQDAHAKAGEAMQAGDAQLAMHHLGHMLRALKLHLADTANAKATATENASMEPDTDDAASEQNANTAKLRARLGRFKK